MEWTEAEKALILKAESGFDLSPVEVARLRKMGIDMLSDEQLQAEARQLSSQVWRIKWKDSQTNLEGQGSLLTEEDARTWAHFMNSKHPHITHWVVKEDPTV